MIPVITEEVKAFLAALPRNNARASRAFTEKEDAIIFFGFKAANKEALAKALHMSTTSVRRRYRELIELIEREKGQPVE